MIHRATHGEEPRLLAIFAHPDDETFLAGGTLAKYAAQGWDVRVISATYGENGRRGDYESLGTNEFADLRRRELQAACKALGIHPPMFLECADRALAAICWNSAAKEIARIIRRLRPDVVITFGPDGISGHPDHVALSQIVTGAFWAATVYRSPRQTVTLPSPASLYYVLRSASVPESCTHGEPGTEPVLTTSIDIGEVGERKLQAIRSYHSQKHLHPTDPAAIQSILQAPEHFHRRFPRWEGGELETGLGQQPSDAAVLSKDAEEATAVTDVLNGGGR
jgi:LmbE family N-acetylglucosaminyl deacetylase